MRAPLPNLLITPKVIELETVSFSAWKILRLFVNTLTAIDKYSLLHREDLTKPIQISRTAESLPYLLITFKVAESEKVSFSAIQNLKTVC